MWVCVKSIVGVYTISGNTKKGFFLRNEIQLLFFRLSNCTNNSFAVGNMQTLGVFNVYRWKFRRKKVTSNYVGVWFMLVKKIVFFFLTKVKRDQYSSFYVDNFFIFACFFTNTEPFEIWRLAYSFIYITLHRFSSCISFQLCLTLSPSGNELAKLFFFFFGCCLLPFQYRRKSKLNKKQQPNKYIF